MITTHYLKVQLLLYQFADSFYSFALALDVFMNIIAHGIDVVEEIGKGRLNHVRLAVVLVAGLGGNGRRPGTYDYYMSEPIVEDDAKGVGPFLLAYTELLRYENK